MSTDSLQERLDRLHDGETLKLEPPLHEFQGPLVVRKPAVIEGQGGTIWAAIGPALQVEAAGVVLRNLIVEITSRDAADGESGCALVVRPLVPVTLDNVAVRGNVRGLEHEEGVWRCPRTLSLGVLRASVAHEFKVRLETPVACTLESEIDGLKVQPHQLPAGETTVSVYVDALPAGTRLRGLLLMRTRQLTRRLPLSAQVNADGSLGNGQLLWPTEGTIPPLDLEPITSPHSPRTVPASPAQPADEAMIVSPFGADPFRTIGDALRQARTGARVLVRPGVYKESLTISKNVEIIGEGEVGDIVVESADSHCLLMRAELARVRGLTLRASTGRSGDHYAVHVPQGRLILEDCRLSSASLACVSAVGRGAAPVLRRCRIHGGASAGVLVHDEAEALLEDCEIFEHALAGVESRRGGHPQLRRCVIHSCGQAGILVHDNGKGTLEECDLHGNGFAGVEVREGGHPILRRCKVHHGRGAGVHIHDGAQATLEDCDLEANTLANLDVRHGGNPSLRRCRLRQSKEAGALFARDAQGTLEDCEFRGNARAAIEIRHEANPTLRRCILRECGAVGVAIRERGRGTLEDCDLAEAAFAVVELRQGSNPLLKRCKIHEGSRAGVLAASCGGGTFEECEIFANQGAGIAACREGNIVLKRCQIHENGQAGVVAWDDGRGVLERCEITGNRLSGLAVLAGGSLKARACKITRNHDSGVWACRGAEGTIEECELSGNRQGSLDLESGSGLQLTSNRLDA